MTLSHDPIKWELSHLKVVAEQLRDLLNHYLQQSDLFRTHAIVEEIERVAMDLRQCWTSVQEYQDTPGEKIPGAVPGTAPGALPGAGVRVRVRVRVRDERSTGDFIFCGVRPVPMIFSVQQYKTLIEQLLTDAKYVVEEAEGLFDSFSN